MDRTSSINFYRLHHHSRNGSIQKKSWNQRKSFEQYAGIRKVCCSSKNILPDNRFCLEKFEMTFFKFFGLFFLGPPKSVTIALFRFLERFPTHLYTQLDFSSELGFWKNSKGYELSRIHCKSIATIASLIRLNNIPRHSKIWSTISKKTFWDCHIFQSVVLNDFFFLDSQFDFF